MMTPRMSKKLWPLAFSLVAAALIVATVAQLGCTADPPSSDVAKAAADASKKSDALSIEAEMVRRNGAIFEGWTQPKLAIVFTGLQQGYIEPCGCSGKENQKGGLSRRDMLLKQLKDKKWPVVALDLGEQVRRFGRQQELKYAATIDALKMMGFQAIGFGPDDLRLSAAELFPIVTAVGNEASPLVAANVGLFAFDDTLPRFRVIEAAGKKIGVTSVVGNEYRQVNNRDIQFKPAAEAIAEVLPKLEAAKCDYLILLSNAGKDESTALAKQFPKFDCILTAGGGDEPPASADSVEGTKTKLVEVGHKGMYAAVLGFYDDPKQPTRFQRVPLDARFGDSPRMKQVLAAYQDQLKELGLDGLGLKPANHPSGRTFVGSKECGECHTKAYAVWKKTPHAQALDTLVHLDPPRQFDPECLSCHVTGWEPQKFTPYLGGYLSAEKTPLLGGNGCENCHGPGSQHVAAERGEIKASDTDLARFRKDMQLSLKTDEGRRKVIDNCRQCHDGDNSIDFKGGDNFDKYWPKVEHHGKD
jgi:hypothetical protein